MAVLGILGVIHEYGMGTADDAGTPRRLRLILRDKPDVTGTWVQAGATDWITTTDRRFWLRLSEVIGFEVLPTEETT